MYGKAPRHQCRECSHILLGIVAVFLSLPQSHNASNREGLITIAWSLAAPWGTVYHYSIILYAQCGIVIIQQFTPLEALSP